MHRRPALLVATARIGGYTLVTRDRNSTTKTGHVNVPAV
jgi:hypothetical protein